MSFFESIEMLPDDPILSITPLYAADPRPHKANLGVGSYKNADGNPLVLNCVKKAEETILKQNLNKEYLPIDGLAELRRHSLSLIFGNNNAAIKNGEIYNAQTIGASGALRVGAEFLAEKGDRTVYLSHPSWSNHRSIFSQAGHKINYYPYYDSATHALDFDKLRQAISEIPPGSVILLHACCHNPTGLDPTDDQWRELSQLIKKYKILPFFDFAYQGFKNGLDADAFAIRLFADEGHEMLVANSYSKNFGLYGERIGSLSIVTHNKDTAAKVGSHIKRLVRSNYSSPPIHGARIIATILGDSALREEWEHELANMRSRIHEMRKALVAGLLAKGDGKTDFSFMNKQSGLFSYTGLDKDQVHFLRQENGIYMPSNGRINVAGLTWKNIDYCIESILAVTDNEKSKTQHI
ncbi:MAG: aspartate/tyrosine/aromatic aminotransferase [Chlamydiales bacterium]|nr:aspartate/tyrosine/aromatic aminotransferase [Chlamydiia bacterium]MCP5507381.1 aspartate/tyrosine/aromatic aminotransferase [Chlamydiales bacterium]